jgi:CHC2 zinc finger
LPDQVGNSGDVTDYFVRLGRSGEDFRRLLKQAGILPQQAPAAETPGKIQINEYCREIEDLKRTLRIENVASQYLELRPSGRGLIGKCPFHGDGRPSFVV